MGYTINRINSFMMKHLLLTLLTLGIISSLFSQDLIWNEDFDSSNNWGTLNQTLGGEGSIANQFWISDAEAGNDDGMCGSAGGGDASLHISTNPGYLGDLGAAYEAGAGFCGSFPSLCPITNKRSISNSITTTGYSNLTINFNYIENGQGSIDNAILEYSTNNGSAWMTLVDMPKSSVCPNSQGLWTAYSMSLPVSTEDIETLQIAFKWTNDDGVGTDPSFAVDDIEIWGMGSEEACFGDFNDDGFVNTADLLALLGEFSCLVECDTDLNGDGIVNSDDMLAFLAVYGTTCD